jgi:hypothetical protein
MLIKKINEICLMYECMDELLVYTFYQNQVHCQDQDPFQ